MSESVDRVTEIAGRVAAASDDYDSNGKSSLYFGREWYYDVRPNDVQFIAHSRSDVEYLLERLRTAEAVIAEAPHDAEECELVLYPELNLYPSGDSECTCWKSAYRAGADHE